MASLLPGLGCAVMMGGMMWLMFRGTKQPSGPPTPQDRPSTEDRDELADLRSEIDRLRAEVRDRDAQSDPTA